MIGQANHPFKIKNTVDMINHPGARPFSPIFFGRHIKMPRYCKIGACFFETSLLIDIQTQSAIYSFL